MVGRPKLTEEQKAERKKEAEAKAKAKRDAMVPFADSPEALEAGIVNEARKITVGEEAMTILDDSKHKNPARTDFADEYNFLFFKAARAEKQAEERAEYAVKMREQAQILKDEPNPEARDTKLKIAKMEAKLAELREKLMGDAQVEV